MRPLTAISAASVLALVAPGCDEPKAADPADSIAPDPAPTLYENGETTTKEFRDSIGVPDSVLKVLPHGAREALRRNSRDIGDDRASRAIAFAVPPASGLLVTRALRRQFAADEVTKKFIVFSDLTYKPDEYASVTIVTRAPDLTDPLFSAAFPHESMVLDDVAELLEDWHESAGALVDEVSRDRIVLSFTTLPEDRTKLLDALVRIGGHFHDTDAHAYDAFEAMLRRDRTVVLGPSES